MRTIDIADLVETRGQAMVLISLLFRVWVLSFQDFVNEFNLRKEGGETV